MIINLLLCIPIVSDIIRKTARNYKSAQHVYVHSIISKEHAIMVRSTEFTNEYKVYRFYGKQPVIGINSAIKLTKNSWEII